MPSAATGGATAKPLSDLELVEKLVENYGGVGPLAQAMEVKDNTPREWLHRLRGGRALGHDKRRRLEALLVPASPLRTSPAPYIPEVPPAMVPEWNEAVRDLVAVLRLPADDPIRKLALDALKVGAALADARTAGRSRRGTASGARPPLAEHG